MIENFLSNDFYSFSKVNENLIFDSIFHSYRFYFSTTLQINQVFFDR